jgi:hypothetical protein
VRILLRLSFQKEYLSKDLFQHSFNKLFLNFQENINSTFFVTEIANTFRLTVRRPNLFISEFPPAKLLLPDNTRFKTSTLQFVVAPPGAVGNRIAFRRHSYPFFFTIPTPSLRITTASGAITHTFARPRNCDLHLTTSTYTSQLHVDTIAQYSHNASSICPPMRCAPVVSLHPQPPFLNSASIQQRLRIGQRSPRHLPRFTIATQRIASAPIAPLSQGPTPPKPSPTQHTPSLTAIAQGRAPRLPQRNTTTPIRRPHTTTSTSARRKQAPPRHGRRGKRHGDEA